MLTPNVFEVSHTPTKVREREIMNNGNTVAMHLHLRVVSSCAYYERIVCDTQPHT